MFLYKKDRVGKGELKSVPDALNFTHATDRNNVVDGGQSSFVVGIDNVNLGIKSILATVKGKVASAASTYSAIIGGWFHFINGGNYNAILGGYFNTIDGGDYSAIIGGIQGKIATLSDYSAILAGYSSFIDSRYSACIGGAFNDITRSAAGADDVSNYIMGMQNKITGGSFNACIGVHLHASGEGVTALGQANRIPVTKDRFAADAEILVVGNGQISGALGASSRSNALTIYRNGKMVADSCTDALINAGSNETLVTKGYLLPKGVYADNAAALLGGLVVNDFYRTVDGTVKIVF